MRRGGWRYSLGQRGHSAQAGLRRHDVSWRHHVLGSVLSKVGWVCIEKGDSSSELAMPILIKAIEHFLWIQKRIRPTRTLEVGKWSALAIVDTEAPTLV